VRYPFHLTEGNLNEQIDGAIYSDGLSCLVESKDTADTKNSEPIAKRHFQLMRRHANVLGIVFSRKGVTDAAICLANSTAPKSRSESGSVRRKRSPYPRFDYMKPRVIG